MGAKTTKVKVTNGVRTDELELTHAESLLNMRGSGWELDDDRFEFARGILTKRNRRK